MEGEAEDEGQKQEEEDEEEDNQETYANESNNLQEQVRKEEAKAAKKTKWIYIDIVRSSEDGEVELSKTEAKYNLDPPPEEKKPFMTKLKEKAMEIGKDKLKEEAEKLLGQ